MSARGFTLIEILVALLVVALGVLGLAGLQVRAQQNAMEAQQRTQALMLVRDMSERIRTARRDLAPCYADALSGGTLGTGNNLTYECSDGFWGGAERFQVTRDLAEWDALLKGLSATTQAGAAAGAMIGARGCITFDPVTDMHTVTVAWQGLAPSGAPSGNTCAQGAYGDEQLRRVVMQSFMIAL